MGYEVTAMPGPGLQPASPSVFVTLGTYNGARYLAEFAESLRRQSYADWRMLVRDDASRDATAGMLHRLAAEEKRFLVLGDDSKRCGPTKNYALLLQRAADLAAEYVFLADQDDVWLPQKIRQQLDLIRRAEAAAGRPTPLLVYSDLEVVDARLKTIHRSFFRHAHFCWDDRRPLNTLLAHNFVPGCCLLMNRPLLELVLPFPSSAPMHDWWIALCAAAAGRLVFLDEPTVRYRQHGANVVGARAWWTPLNPLRSDWKQRWQRGMVNFARHVEQVEVLRRRLQQRDFPCRTETVKLLDRYGRLFQTSKGVLGRIHRMHRLGIPQTGLLRRLVFYARLLGANRW